MKEHAPICNRPQPRQPDRRWCYCFPSTSIAALAAVACFVLSVWTWADTALIVEQNKALTQENVKMIAQMHDFIAKPPAIQPHH